MTSSTAPRSGDGRDHYGSDDHVEPRRLVPGVTVRRYTEPALGRRLDVAVPCCQRVARLPTVDQILQRARLMVGCPACGLIFDATVIDEGDGGHACLLVVRNDFISLARRHRKPPAPTSATSLNAPPPPPWQGVV